MDLDSTHYCPRIPILARTQISFRTRTLTLWRIDTWLRGAARGLVLRLGHEPVPGLGEVPVQAPARVHHDPLRERRHDLRVRATDALQRVYRVIKLLRKEYVEMFMSLRGFALGGLACT